jgi:hypothetical protein
LHHGRRIGLGARRLRRRHWFGGRLVFGLELILQLSHLLLQLRHTFARDIVIRFVRLLGWLVEQGIPLFPCLMEVQRGFSIDRKTQQKQAGNRCHGRYGNTHVDPSLLMALSKSCGAPGVGTIKVIVFMPT